MYAFLISSFLAVASGCALAYGTGSIGWSVTLGVVVFLVSQFIIGRKVQSRVKLCMEVVQGILVEGQKQLQAKMQRWQIRPPGSMKEAQAEMMRDQRRFVGAALQATEAMHAYDRWVPLMKRQIATAQFQLHWMVKDFEDVDRLMPKVLFVDPVTSSMKLARLYMTGAKMEDMVKAYEKAVRRARYNQNVLPAATMSWIYMQRKDADSAFKVLTAALKNSDNQTLKINHEHLMNNRVTHFSNAGLADQWYSLHLEEPRVRQQRQRMQWR